MKRTLGKSGIEVPAVGMGCWAIGGRWAMTGDEAGWGEVDDAESTRAIHAAMEHGAMKMEHGEQMMEKGKVLP